MPKVFVVQVPSRREAGEWVPKYDLTAAEAFGRLLPILPPGNVPIDPTASMPRLRDALRTFDFGSDHLLLLGDPVAIARAVAALCARRAFLEEATGASLAISILKWDRRTEQYESCPLD